MRELAAVGAMVALSACVEPDPSRLRCPGALELPLLPQRTAMLGVPTSQVLRIPCLTAGAEVSGLTVAVLDTAGERAAFTSSPLTLLDGTLSTTVDFTPTSTGVWTVFATVEPALGDVGAAVLVMNDRSGEQPAFTFTMPKPEACSVIEVAGSLAGCSGASLRVFLDGGLLAEAPRAQLRAAGDVLWSWNPAGVSRWQGELRAELATPLTSAVAVSADESRLIVVDRGDVWEFVTMDGGALERRAVLLDGGVAQRQDHMLAVDGGWVWEEDGQACFRGVTTQTRCSPFLSSFGQHVIGVEGDGFWVQGVQLSFVRFGAGPERLSSASLDQPLAVIPAAPVQLVHGHGQAVTVRAGTMQLELWPAFLHHRVTTRHFLGIRDQQVSVFER